MLPCTPTNPFLRVAHYLDLPALVLPCGVGKVARSADRVVRRVNDVRASHDPPPRYALATPYSAEGDWFYCAEQ